MHKCFRTHLFTLLSAATAAAAVLVTSSAGVQAAQKRSYLMATATTGGTYYPVGVAIATLAKVKLQPKYHFSISAITSAGSAENVKLLRENQVQFAILQGLYGAWARHGTGVFKKTGKVHGLRAISMLWLNTEDFVILSKYVKSGTIMDMANIEGQKFSIGARESGTEGSGRTILRGLGFNPDKDFNLAYLGYNPSANALENGTIAGFNIPGGMPVSAISQAAAVLKSGMRILSFSSGDLAKVNAEAGTDLWVPFTIPANTYAGQTEPVHSIAQPNFLAVRADVPDDVVYRLTKAIYENLPFLRNIHKATSEMALSKAIGGLPFPLHPGALKFYKEQGLKIPSSLIAK